MRVYDVGLVTRFGTHAERARDFANRIPLRIFIALSHHGLTAGPTASAPRSGGDRRRAKCSEKSASTAHQLCFSSNAR